MIVLLIIAALSDSRNSRIPNRLIVIGYCCGLTYCVLGNGTNGIIIFLIKAIWPIGMLYILFCIRGLGAGDIKLFSAISPFLEMNMMIKIILYSFFIGAGIACYRIRKIDSFTAIFTDLGNYVNDCIKNKRVLKYSTHKIEKLDFGLCILAGFICALIGEEIIEIL